MISRAGDCGSELGGERKGAAVADLERFFEVCLGAFGAANLRINGEGVTVGRVEGKVGSVEFNPDRNGSARGCLPRSSGENRKPR